MYEQRWDSFERNTLQSDETMREKEHRTMGETYAGGGRWQFSSNSMERETD
jgi:hypothetical protein